MNIDANIVEIYYFVDDFVKEYSKIIKNGRGNYNSDNVSFGRI